MSNYTSGGCMDIVEAAFKKCLPKTEDREEIKTRIDFVTKGCMFLAWCAVSEYDPEKLRNIVLIRNHKYLKEI